MARIDKVNLNTENSETVRHHYSFALDQKRTEDVSDEIVHRITNLLEQAEKQGLILKAHFVENHSECVDEEYKDR